MGFFYFLALPALFLFAVPALSAQGEPSSPLVVHGQVLGSPKRLPVAGARVAAGEQSVVTDAEGRF